MNLTSNLANLIMATSLAMQTWIAPIRPAQKTADWCQCVIFVLNLLGIDQIPGEYWTAGSLSVPDKGGMTWMDYQGYTIRPSGELPETGDLLVLSGGAQVITVQTWNDTEHLVPVPVDVWAGHIGVVLKAQETEKEGTAYYQVNLLSANWGVNARNLGVVGSCYNADASEFLVERGNKKASFFYASDPQKMRERMVNRAERWGMLGIASGENTTMDGFPITPGGFVSNVLQPTGDTPIVPSIMDVSRTLNEIDAGITLPGDFVVSGGTENPGLGVITALKEPVDEKRWEGEVIYMPGKGRMSGPDLWRVEKIFSNWTRISGSGSGDNVRFFRYADLPGYPALMGSGRIMHAAGYGIAGVEFTLINAGGKELNYTNIVISVMGESEDFGLERMRENTVQVSNVVALSPGEKREYGVSINVPKSGNYRVVIHYTPKTGVYRLVGEIPGDNPVENNSNPEPDRSIS